jgi:amino acid adenylation domain-containing protein
MSFAQQRLWFLDQLEPGKSVYNIPEAIRLKGLLNVEALEQAINEIVQRHESLRTTFALVDGHPVQIVAPSLHVRPAIWDFRRLPESERERQAARSASEQAGRPFDLQSGPLLRVTLFQLNNDEHVLLLVMHHIVSEGGWSMSIFLQEMGILYNAYSSGRTAFLPELAIQYGDYSVWQRGSLQGEVLEPHLAYWKVQLEGAPAVVDWPADRQRPAVQTHEGSRTEILLPKDLTDAINALSRREGSTLFTTLLAAFQTLLYRCTSQEDLVVGVPVARRTQQTQDLIGLFLNTIPLRSRLSGDISFRQFMKQVRRVVFDGLAHQDLPFEVLVDALHPDRSLAFTPVVQVMFSFQNAPRHELELTGLTVTPFDIEIRSSMFDLTLFAWEKRDGLRTVFEYSTDLFEPGTIKRMLSHFQVLLEDIVKNPDEQLSELSLLTDAEREQLLIEWNQTEVAYPKDRCLHQLIEDQAAKAPDQVALVFDQQRMSYGELNRRANQLAHHLQGLGVGPDSLVGLYVERSLEMIVGLLGILKAGGAYVPMDPAYPKECIRYILEDSKAPIVLTQKSLVSELPDFSGQPVCLDSGWAQIATRAEENPVSKAKPENLAYVLFTSGSTGRPKGVALEHRCAVSFIQWANQVFTSKQLEGVLFSTSVCFDLSVFELFVTLSAGGKVIIAPNILHLPTLPAKSEITLINTVPSAISELLRVGDIPDSVKTVNLAGEALSDSLAAQIYASTKVDRLYNLYGPTETTTYSTYTLVARGCPVTIGKPIANTQAYILDANRKPVPIGVPGELYLAGAGVARGYYGRPDLTGERFVADPFSSRPGACMYRTGDICTWLPDGDIRYVGRADHQVKLRGFRIELEEIETALSRHEAVRQCVVVAREDTPGDKRLVAYFEPRTESTPTVSDLRGYLAKGLPDYMVPSIFVPLEKLPATPNGKVDRKALPLPEIDRSAQEQSYVAPRNETERKLAEIWSKMLRVEQVGVNDNFFNVGGHSLLAIQAVSRIRDVFGVKIGIQALFDYPTIAGLANVLTLAKSSEAKTDQQQLLVRIRPGTSERPPFFCLHGAEQNVLNMRPLAIALPADLPFYCFQDKGLDGSEPFESIEETARCYVDEIRQVQPHGPYYLGGYCYGGFVAFEIARRLEELGEAVAALVLIETSNPTFVRSLSAREWLFRSVRFYMWRVAWHTRRMLTKRPDEWLGYISKALRSHMGAARLEAQMIKFVLKPYGGGALIFRASARNFDIYDDYCLGWESVVRGDIECFEIEGDHLSILEEPAVRLIAEKLNAELVSHRPGLGMSA